MRILIFAQAQHNVPSQGSNPDHSMRSPAHEATASALYQWTASIKFKMAAMN